LNEFLEADAAMYAEEYEADDWDPNDPSSAGGNIGDGGAGDLWGEEIDDGIIESLLIVSLAAALAGLIWYRQQRQAQERQRQQEEANADGRNGLNAAIADLQNQAQQLQGPVNGGFPPQPGNPGWDVWGQGGVVQ